MIQISRQEYISLLVRAHELQLMNQAGVDNWEGMDHVDWDELAAYEIGVGIKYGK